MSDVNDLLSDYEDSSLNKIVKNNIDDVDELNSEFNDFMDQSFKKRRDADDVSITLTGLTNQQRYEKQMDDLVSESGPIDITQDKIELAKAWSDSTGIFMVYPCDDINVQFAKYLSQPNDKKRVADWKALEIFGIDNPNLYRFIKYNIANIEPEKENSIYSLGQDLKFLREEYKPTSFTETVEANHLEKKILERIKKLSKEQEYKCEYMYIPYFHPKEITELEGYYSDEVDDECNEIFKEYMNYFYGYENNFNPINWDTKVRQLCYKLEYANNISDSNMYKQSLVKIGWNPEIKYNAENQLKAKNRHEKMVQESYKHISILNMEPLFNVFNESEVMQESKMQKLYPVSIVLVRGNSKFSDVIVKVTNGPYSHSALCLDNDFKRLYSFNMNNTFNYGGGLSLENIAEYPQDNNVAVFTFFIDKNRYDTMNKNVQELLYDIKNSKYSIANILALPFKKINLNMTDKMICSQFVDKMLKLANIDLTGADSSKVTPNYLYSMCIGNSKVYKIYEGPVKGFNYKKATKFVDSLSKHPRVLSESVLEQFTINQYKYAIVSEAKKLPIQVNNKGDILLTNPMIDFEAEYSASHKLLMQYSKVNNIDGMKYELSRLYYMNYLLEKKIHSNKYKKKKDANIKVRARILNDFNKYIKEVLKADSNFNFAQYYESSPFYANSVQIDNGTVKGIKSLINCIL